MDSVINKEDVLQSFGGGEKPHTKPDHSKKNLKTIYHLVTAVNAKTFFDNSMRHDVEANSYAGMLTTVSTVNCKMCDGHNTATIFLEDVNTRVWKGRCEL